MTTKQLRPGATWGEAEALNDVLTRFGFTTSKTRNGSKLIYQSRREVFSGRAAQVWAWLRNGCPVAAWFKEVPHA